MVAPKNYKELTDKMLQLFTDISEDKISIDKANSMVKTSNGIVNIQRTKILSTRVTGDKEIKFFKD